MDRRELLKAIVPLIGAPVLVKGEEVGKAFKIEPDGKYLVFVNSSMFDHSTIEEICNTAPLPAGTPVYPIFPYNEGMDEAIRIFKL
jgi:hypothetical protein